LGGRWSMTGGHLSFLPAVSTRGDDPPDPPRGPASCTGPRRWPSSRRRGRPDPLRWPPTAFSSPFAVLVLLFRIERGCHFSGVLARERAEKRQRSIPWVAITVRGRMGSSHSGADGTCGPCEPGLEGTFQIPGSCDSALAIPPCVTKSPSSRPGPYSNPPPEAKARAPPAAPAKLLLRVTVCHLDSSNINSILVTYAGADFAGQRAF
jgi:hypothetical protein